MIFSPRIYNIEFLRKQEYRKRNKKNVRKRKKELKKNKRM